MVLVTCKMGMAYRVELLSHGCILDTLLGLQTRLLPYASLQKYVLLFEKLKEPVALTSVSSKSLAVSLVERHVSCS